MAGGGVNDVWAKFPNPADKCKAVHFALQYGEYSYHSPCRAPCTPPHNRVPHSAE